MPPSGRFGPRLLSSAAVSVLAACAAVLAHLVAAGHRPGAGLVLGVALALGVADATVATVLRGTWGVALRAVALQVVAHAVLTTAAAVGGTTHASVAGAHHVVPLGAPSASADLLPSAPMWAAHLLVGAVVALLLARTDASTAAALAAAHVVRAVAALLRLVLPRAVRLVRPRVLHVRVDVPDVAVRGGVWTGASPVRRGPPVRV